MAYSVFYAIATGMARASTPRAALGGTADSSNAFATWCSSVLVALGYAIFCMPKAPKGYLRSACWGGLYGLIVYGSHALIDSSSLRSWSFEIARVDLIAGGASCALLAVLQTYWKQRI